MNVFYKHQTQFWDFTLSAEFLYCPYFQ